MQKAEVSLYQLCVYKSFHKYSCVVPQNPMVYVYHKCRRYIF